MSKRPNHNNNNIKTMKLIEHPDFFSLVDGNNYLAKICAMCSYRDLIQGKTSCNYKTDETIINYWFKSSDDFWDYPRHYVSFMGKKAFVIYRRQSSDCCLAKKGEIVVCVAYTEENHRNKGLMTKLLSSLTEKYRHIVVDTYLNELITVCKKLGIKSFKGNF